MEFAEKEPDLSGGEGWLLLKKELNRKISKYDKDEIHLQISNDNTETIIWNSGRGDSNETRLTKGYLERNKWPVAKQLAEENQANPS